MQNPPNQNFAGVRVFGSSIIRVMPDSAAIAIAVSRMEQEPQKAFASARAGAGAVQEFLKEQSIQDFGNSRISLSQEFRYIQSEQRFMGYKARIVFGITLRELDRIEVVLSGVISAGANELTSVNFETTRLKQIRSEARAEAVAAAREKAELYCHEAGVSIGRVLAIEDSNPDMLTGVREGQLLTGGAAAGDGAGEKPIDPAMISIGASVFLTFEIAA